jgi:hypothetical protein
MFPRGGPGTHQLDRGEHKFLKNLNLGDQDTALRAARLEGLSEEKISRVLALRELCQ